MAFLYLRPLSSPGHYFIRSLCVHSGGQTDSIELVHNLASPGPCGSKWALPLLSISPPHSHLFPPFSASSFSRRKRSTPCTGRESERRRERLNPSFFHPWTLSSLFFFFFFKQRELSAPQPTQAFDEGDGAGGDGGVRWNKGGAGDEEEAGWEVRWLPIGEGIHFPCILSLSGFIYWGPWVLLFVSPHIFLTLRAFDIELLLECCSHS